MNSLKHAISLIRLLSKYLASEASINITLDCLNYTATPDLSGGIACRVKCNLDPLPIVGKLPVITIIGRKIHTDQELINGCLRIIEIHISKGTPMNTTVSALDDFL